MKLRVWLTGLVSTAVLSTAMFGASAATATTGGATCPTLAPGSIHVQSAPGGTCLDHGQYFDVAPTASDVESASAVAISGDGKRALFARAVADPDCVGDPVGQKVAVYPGIVTALNTTWLDPVYITTGCEVISQGMSLSMNSTGRFAGLAYSTAGVSIRHLYAQPISWPANSAPVAVGNDTTMTFVGIYDIVTSMKASVSRNGASIFFSGGVKGAGLNHPDGSYMALYDTGRNDQMTWMLPEPVVDSGISADGVTTFAITREAVTTTPATANVKTYVCHGSPQGCPVDVFRIAHQDANFEARGAINDAGTEMAVSWTRPLGAVTRHFATAFPSTFNHGTTIEAPVNIHPVTNDDTRNADALPIVLSPKGDRLWVGGLDVEASTTFALSAAVNKYVLTWAEPNKTDISVPDSNADGTLAVSRSGRVVAALTNANLQTGVISVADGNVGPAKWQPAFLSGGSGWYTNSYQLALSDDGSRYVAGFTTSSSPARAVVTTGVLLPFQFASKLPKLTGKLKVGTTLKVSGDKWKIAGGTNTYQWLRDGAWITNATKATYRLTADDLGHIVTVAVRHRKTGYYDRLLIAGAIALVTR